MKKVSILLTTIALFFCSCSSGSNSESSAATAARPPVTQAYDNSLAKGAVMDSVSCKNNSQSYALYLPSYYTVDKKFPCIYFFDAHARGPLPVRMYKELAEKYGFVLVGSNASKNGTAWEETNDGVKALMEDTRARINIDPQRIYTSGFSGGSRVASSVAIVDGGVAGVIGCAAGFPQVEHGIQHKFDYFGMVGDDDFNLREMEQLDGSLEQNGFTHQLLTFSGKHGWPPAADFETSLLWIQVNAMKENLQPKNDTLATALKNDYDKRIAAATASGNLVKTQGLLAGLVSIMASTPAMAPYQKQLATMIAGTAYKNAVTARAQLQQAELSQQQELAKEFAAHDAQWWAKKIAELNRKVHNAKAQQEAQMNRRLVNFLGLIGYMNASHALNTGDLANAGTYLQVFKLADPQNADCSYLTAIYYMKKGDAQKAIVALSEAASLGYSDVTQLMAEPVFSNIQNDVAFKNAVTKMHENMAKQP